MPEVIAKRGVEMEDESQRSWFEAEVENLLPGLYGTALRLTCDQTDAEDLVSDALMKAWSCLGSLPLGALESFAGVGHPFAAEVIGRGDDVLDVGSGSGTDVLIASRLVGSEGSVTGLDMTRAMREKLEANAVEMGAGNVRTVDGNAEDLPLPDGSVSVVTSNGVLNLVPDKEKAIHEIFRVLRAGGRIQIADIVVSIPPSEACRAQPQLWAECIVGAVTTEKYLAMLEDVGFEGVTVLETLDYFAASPSEETQKVAASFGAQAIVITARKPD